MRIASPHFNFVWPGVRRTAAFTLIEVMIVVTLLSFIVLALMAVFNSTQAAFRASITQTDVLEGGRAVMDLMAGDLKTMSPSLGYSNGAVNFYANTNLNNASLIEPLVASSFSRTNVLENFFILSRHNQTWTGVGYVVDATNMTAINPLYRFSMSTNAAVNPLGLYKIFINDIALASWTNMSHLIDGVVDLRLRAFDINGYWMTNNQVFDGGNITTNRDVFYLPSALGVAGFYMYSNTLPAAVEIQMATLEDRTLLRAGSISDPNSRSNYLSQQSGKLHVFRQRVSIPNADPAAYQ